MKSIYAYFFFAICLFVTGITHAVETPAHRRWTVDGVVREALVYAPLSAKTDPVPVIFAFHGHGGSMERAARMFGFQDKWPSAIIVYMQGLKTPGQLTDLQGRRSGWQFAVGEQDDRDLKFFTAVLESLKQDYHLDDKRVYATGHSNGGAFAYLLWAAYGDRIAAFAPSGAAAPRLLDQLTPKPVMHIAGQNDPLVKLEWQKQTIDALRTLNRCDKGKPWEQDARCTIYPSRIGVPVLTYIHHLGHRFPEDATAIIVTFFKAHSLLTDSEIK